MSPELPDGLAVLTAMITPAVLLSACATLIIATTSRLNRAVERSRELSRRFTDLQQQQEGNETTMTESRMLFVQLDYSTTRSRLLQRALAGLYYSVGTFVATSVAIAVAALSGRGVVIPITLGVTGSALMLYASLVMVRESRIALMALKVEMDYVWAQGRARASNELLELARAPRRGLRRIHWSPGRGLGMLVPRWLSAERSD
jgi:hypothetical protein